MPRKQRDWQPCQVEALVRNGFLRSINPILAGKEDPLGREVVFRLTVRLVVGFIFRIPRISKPTANIDAVRTR